MSSNEVYLGKVQISALESGFYLFITPKNEHLHTKGQSFSYLRFIDSLCLGPDQFSK